MDAIVAVTEDWGIGKDGDMLFHIHADLKRFKEITMGHPILMGRKTLESLPGKKGLPGRANYVLTSNLDYTGENCTIIHTLDNFHDEDSFCIGGASLYAQLLNRFSHVYVTKIFAQVPADTYFPDLDADPSWEVTHKSEIFSEGNIRFQYLDYSRKI